jgi:hypothetical protein
MKELIECIKGLMIGNSDKVITIANKISGRFSKSRRVIKPRDMSEITTQIIRRKK